MIISSLELCISFGVVMIERVDKTYSKDEVMSLMEPLISKWFNERFDSLTIPQAKAIPVIHQRRSVLVSSPTGSGKTLTAFTSIINELTRYSREGTLEERVYCIYVSPLKALANDVERNLTTPLAEMKEVAEINGMDIPDIRVAVRSGDTPQNERQKMVRHPPHILITTPESLALVLAAPKFRESFKKVEWVILDEIHDICDSKRGAFLSLILERLRNHCENEFVRIGLSATLAPIEAIAGFLVGCNPDGTTRDVALIESGSKKQLDLKVICPTEDLTTLSSDIVNSMMYDTLKDLIDQHETTLVFTNTRSGAESVVYKLKERGLENVEVHHSSLGKEIRLDVEARLKRGEIKCVVSSTSLELGIDIGSVDLVCQIGSPKSVAKGLQRIGRSGHSFGKIAKGRLLVFDPDDLVECAVLCRAAHTAHIDRVGIPENCLDVLSQMVVGMSIDNRWDVNDAYDLVKGSYCYRNLPEESFIQVLRYLGSKDEFEGVYSKIWFDEEQAVFGRKKGSRMIYFMNIGTIPEEANYRVITNHGTVAGELSEKFVEKLSPRDVFVLGGRSFEFVRSKGMTAHVKEANGRKPTVPSWAGEMLPRSFDLSMDIAEFRKEMESRIKEPDDQAISELTQGYDIDEGSARSVLSYFREQAAVAGFIPDCDRLAVEEYIDPSGNQKLVFHFPFGRRVNDALSRAYAYRMTTMMGANVSVTISDDNFMLGCPRKFDISRIPGLIKSGELESVLRKSIKDSEIFKLRFRHTAARSFMILRNYMGRPISVNRQQVRSSYLLETLGGMENVPVIEETYREVLEDDMDIKSARYILEMIDSGKMSVLTIPFTGTPSPFAHCAILSGFSDIVLMEDRSALLRELHRKVLYRALGDNIEDFEFTEDQIVPYFASKIDRISSKEDIPKLLMQTGPLQALRERGRNIYTYTDEDRKTVDGWIRELLRDNVIGSVFLDESHIMVASEIPYYAAATRRERSLSETEKAVLDRIDKNTALSDIASSLELSDDMVFRAVRKLESMYLVARTDIAGPSKWLFSRVEYKKEDRRESIDRIILRYLNAYAPATVQEVAYSLSLADDDARESLESLVSSEEVSKGRFLIAENDQYMLKIDHMRLRSGKSNIYDYDTVERYRLTKGQHFPDIRSYFEFHCTAGWELDAYNKIDNFSLEQWYSMRESGELLLGRFMRGKVRYVLKEDGDRYAVMRHEDVTAEDRKLLETISSMGSATLRDLIRVTGMEKTRLKESISRLDRSLLLVRSFDEKEDWGTENTYAPYHPSEVSDNAQENLLMRAIRAYGPVPANALHYFVGMPIDEIESVSGKLGASTISVGEGQTPMLIMSDEIPNLENVPRIEFPIRLCTISDPNIASRWSEFNARYGDKLMFPFVRGSILVGAVEMWEMSGCIEIRQFDLDSPDMLNEALDALDFMMGFYRQKGIDIIRIREILGTDAESLDDETVKCLTSHGYIKVNGFYAKGITTSWTMNSEQLISYVFSKQHISKTSKYKTFDDAMADRGYIRGDQEALIRIADRIDMKKQMERGSLIKMTLTPSYQGYTTRSYAHLFRESKEYVPDEVASSVISFISAHQPVSKKNILEASPYSPERVSDSLSELNKASVIYTDENSMINLVTSENTDMLDGLEAVARLHFKSFGIFSADGLASFLDARMALTRKVLRRLEDDGTVTKGYFVEGDPTLMWMLTDDVGKCPPEFTETFVLNSQDNLHIYFRSMIKQEVGTTMSVVFSGTKIIGSFKGKVCTSGAKVEDFKGSEEAMHAILEAAQFSGVSVPEQEHKDDDDWDILSLSNKLNLGI